MFFATLTAILAISLGGKLLNSRFDFGTDLIITGEASGDFGRVTLGAFIDGAQAAADMLQPDDDARIAGRFNTLGGGDASALCEVTTSLPLLRRFDVDAVVD